MKGVGVCPIGDLGLCGPGRGKRHANRSWKTRRSQIERRTLQWNLARQI